ncbi:hypothetical protein ACQ4PT_065404 [Festuca glaucescens]
MAMVEGKSLDEARWHHELLVEDMAGIEPAESTPRLAWLGHPPWSSSPTSPQTSSASPTMELAFRVIFDLSQIGSANNFSSHQRQDFRVDDHAGLTADGRVLSGILRNECINHAFVYNAPNLADKLWVIGAICYSAV